jgi:hypothetical protein
MTLPVPTIEPLGRLDRPGKLRCWSTRPAAWGGVHVVEGTGYTEDDAYEKWLNALCRAEGLKRSDYHGLKYVHRNPTPTPR